MVKVLFVVAALLAVQATLVVSKVIPIAAAPAEEHNTLTELAAKAQKAVHEAVKTLGLDHIDTDTVVARINTDAKQLATHVNEAVKKLQTEISAHKPEVDKVIEDVKKQLTKTSEDVEKLVGPDAAAKGKELRAGFEKGLKDAVAQVEKLVKAVEPDAGKFRDDVNKTARALLDQIVEIGKNVEKQLKSTVDDHEKTHKN